jgi:hypothetical protein
MPPEYGYNGVYRAKVVDPPGSLTGLWVIVPRLNGDAPMGPCQHLGAAPSVGDKVLVATIAGLKDDLVILAGALS